ncbi:MAG: transglutaminase family protein [Alphaproteobacteria bacterium]
MIYDVSHRTTFDYTYPVSISHHVLHLTPRDNPRQTCHRATIIVTPAPTVRAESVDYFGNPVTHFTVQDPHEELIVHASSRVEVSPRAVFDLDGSAPWESVVESAGTVTSEAALDAVQYAFDSPYIVATDDVEAFAREVFAPGRPVLEATLALTQRIFAEFRYQGGVTDVSTPVSQVLATRKGVCQDFAHLQIACLRRLGLPARYVSGYLLTHPPEGQAKKIGADASHAWLAVWSPDHGWIDFDPTNNMMTGDEHITIGWGRDYGDVSPINGFMVGGGEHEIEVAVDVNPVDAAA